MVVKSDGSTLVAGQIYSSVGLIQLTSSGQLDTTFGSGGVATLSLPSGDSLTSLQTMLLGGNGQIILVGTINTGSPTSSVFVARLNSDGSLDSTFGSGGLELFSGTQISSFSAALQPNGQIILARTLPDPLSPTEDYEIGVIRLNTDGSTDTTFGTSGLTTISSLTTPDPNASTPNGDSPGGIAVQSNGQIIVTGTYLNTTGMSATRTPEIHRLDSNGTLDDSGLTQSGIIAAALGSINPNGLIIEPDGRFLLDGSSPSLSSASPTLALLNSDGSLVRQTAAPELGGGLSNNPFALLPNGDVVAVGIGSDPTTAAGTIGLETDRFTPDLTPDDTFGVAGKSYTFLAGPSGVGSVSIANSDSLVAVGPAGQILVTTSIPGQNSSLNSPVAYSAVIRLTSTGSAHPGDYTGDGIADPAVYLPDQGVYAIRPSQGGPDQVIPFGIPGAGQTIPAPGDYFGTGIDDIAVYLTSIGSFGIRNPAGGPDEIIPFGIAGEGQTIPAPGDYFGTGQTDLAVYLPSIGAFGIRNPAGGPDEIIPFGIAGAGQSIPVPGDYDGSGKTELAVYLPSLGEFAYRPAIGGPDQIISFGLSGAGNTIPVPGDYDHSGRTELAVYLPSIGSFIYRPAFGGAPDQTVPFGVAGTGQTIPAPGDYTGSGQWEFGVYLPASGLFAYRPESPDTLQKVSQTGPPLTTGPDVSEPFGVTGTGQTLPVTFGNSVDFLDSSNVSARSLDLPAQDIKTDTLDFLSVTTTRKKTTTQA